MTEQVAAIRYRAVQCKIIGPCLNISIPVQPGQRNKMAAGFTHFLPQKFLPMSRDRVINHSLLLGII